MKIEVQGLSKKIKNVDILQDISLNFEGGHIYGLKGRNGSGKSMFLKVLCNLAYYDKGSILINGNTLDKSVDNFPIKVGASIESPSFFSYLTGLENLKLLASLKQEISVDDIQNILKVVRLDDDMNKKYGKYSLGMKQKLAIAQAIMESPDLLVLDEPFNGIEKETVSALKDYLLSLKDSKRIIIITSHIEDDLKYLCDTIIEIENGNIVS